MPWPWRHALGNSSTTAFTRSGGTSGRQCPGWPTWPPGLRYFADGDLTHLRWTEAWLGLAACFKHDVAAYVAVGTALSLVVSWWRSRQTRPSSWKHPVSAVLVVAVCALAAATPLAVWTAWSAGPEAWDQLFVFPITVFHQVRGELFPPLTPDLDSVGDWLSDPTSLDALRRMLRRNDTWAVFRAPQLTFFFGVAAVLLAGRWLDAAGRALVALFVACMPFFWAAAHIQHNTHPYTLAILSTGIGVVLWSRVARGRVEGMSRWVDWRPPVGVAVALACTVYAGSLVSSPIERTVELADNWRSGLVIDLPGMRGFRLPPWRYYAYEPVGRFLRTHTSEGEPIFAGLTRHDVIVINDPLLYAVADRPVCCGYTELHPGVADRGSVQQRIIRGLEAHAVRALVLWDFGWPRADLERRKRLSAVTVPDAPSTRLDRYIEEHFRKIAEHGEFQIFWRRDLPTPVGL